MSAGAATLGVQQVDGLAAGATTRVRFDGVSFGAAGDMEVLAWVDADGAIAETNEANNRRTLWISVTNAAPPTCAPAASPCGLTIVGPDAVKAGAVACYSAVLALPDGKQQDATLECVWSVSDTSWCVVEAGVLAVWPDLSADQMVKLSASCGRAGCTAEAVKAVMLTP